MKPKSYKYLLRVIYEDGGYKTLGYQTKKGVDNAFLKFENEDNGRKVQKVVRYVRDSSYIQEKMDLDY